MADYRGTDANDSIDQDKLGIPAGSNIFGGKGDDTIVISSGTAVGEQGNDTITALQPWAGVAYWGAPAGIKVNLATGIAQDGYGTVDTLINIRTIQDSSHSDEITGSGASEEFWLSGGSDRVSGGGGQDTVKYWEFKPSEIKISYARATDTFTAVKQAPYKTGTDTLQGVNSIQLLGPDGNYAQYTRDMFDDSTGFLRQQATVASFEMHHVNQLRAGDFNGDGIGDLLVTRTRGDLGETAVPLQILVGDGKGGFTDKTAGLFKGGIPHVNYVPRIFAGDFNKDGITDIFTPDFGLDKPPFPGGQNSLFLSNKATGLLENASATLPQGLKQNHGTALGDINRDGHLDILVNALHDTTGNGNQILINDGAGRFTPTQSLLPASLRPAGYDPGNTWSMLRDLNGDGWDDIVLGTWKPNPSPSLVLLNDGKGSFANSTPLALPRPGGFSETVIGIETIDLNGDALPDLMLSLTNDGSHDEFYKLPYLQLLVNEGNGRFRDETGLRLPQSQTPGKDTSWYLSATAIDFNGDGFQDILVDGMNASSSHVLVNDGTGKFTLGWNGTPNQHVVSMDINGDGKPDLVEATAAGFSVLLNTAPDRIGASHVYRFGDNGGKVVGGAASETIHNGRGADSADGGAGLDKMVYGGKRADYSVKKTSDGFSVSSGGVTDTLVNIERLVFGDAAVALDIEGTGGQAYRVYQAAFARTPDLGGLGYWMNAMDLGTTLESVAEGFVASKEFKDLYGAAPTNLEIVTRFYQNVLQRPGEKAGIDWWTGLLDAKTLTVADVLVGFSESAENKAALVGVMTDGFAYTPYP
ncbi:FG-GAP-like repeat-containing protein [Massilia sp. BHUDP2]|uniref:FG-GAP-like repeat-containing protein n=1 Tax=Massilia sp. BHUDP2 TaxID=3034505 RepID=UPI003905C879